MFIKGKGLLTFWNLSEKDDKLNEIIDVSLQTINQRSIIHLRMFFLLAEKVIVISKAYKILFVNITEINVCILCLKRIFA